MCQTTVKYCVRPQKNITNQTSGKWYVLDNSKIVSEHRKILNPKMFVLIQTSNLELLEIRSSNQLMSGGQGWDIARFCRFGRAHFQTFDDFFLVRDHFFPRRQIEPFVCSLIGSIPNYGLMFFTSTVFSKFQNLFPTERENENCQTINQVPVT